VKDKTDAVNCEQFSSLLNSLEDYPVNARKTFNGAISTLFEELMDYEKSLKYLKKHNEYIVSEFPDSCKVQSMIESHEKQLEIIDKGINRLSHLINI